MNKETISKLVTDLADVYECHGPMVAFGAYLGLEDDFEPVVMVEVKSLLERKYGILIDNCVDCP